MTTGVVICLSIRAYLGDSHWTDFRENSTFGIFAEFCVLIPILVEIRQKLHFA